jgi:hypothetical protein
MSYTNLTINSSLGVMTFTQTRQDFMQHLQEHSHEDPTYGYIHKIHGNFWISTDKPYVIGNYAYLIFTEVKSDDDRIFGTLQCVSDYLPPLFIECP